jgi:hypothetical protein
VTLGQRARPVAWPPLTVQAGRRSAGKRQAGRVKSSIATDSTVTIGRSGSMADIYKRVWYGSDLGPRLEAAEVIHNKT